MTTLQDVAKLKEVLLYVLRATADKPNVGETVLHKLLYFMDFDYYEIHEEYFLGGQYKKNHFGPTMVNLDEVLHEMVVNNEVEHWIEPRGSYEQRCFRSLRDPNMDQLSADDIAHIDWTLDRFSDMNATTISHYSHSDYPWIIANDGDILDYRDARYRNEDTSVAEYDEL